MRRREFLRLGAAGLLATTLSALPVSFPVPPTHGGPYGEEFFDSVRRHMIEVVRREGRAPRRLEIGPPRDGQRECVLHLEAGGSLLDKVVFVWNEGF